MSHDVDDGKVNDDKTDMDLSTGSTVTVVDVSSHPNC